MFRQIAGFEFRYQLRQPVFWVVVAVFFLLTFASMTVEQVRIGSGGNVHKNAPFAIAQVCLTLTIFFMFATAAFVANIVTRDDETRYGPIIRASRLSKRDYLYGRFAGAFGAVAVCFLSVPLAIFLGSLMPWVDPDTLGPNRIGDYAYAYFLLALPGVFLTSAGFFALATVTRSMMATYVGVMGFFVVFLIANVILQRPEFRDLAALVEPFGLAAVVRATRYWTATERNAGMPPFADLLLVNRLIWLSVGAALLALAYPLYRFQDPQQGGRSLWPFRRKTAEARAATPASGPLPKPQAGPGTAWARLSLRTRFEMRQVFLSPAFFVILALGVFNSLGGLLLGEDIYGGEPYPTTLLIVQTLEGSFSIVPILIAIFYAGELVWRERDRRTHEIVDATPVPDWAFVIPKSLAIALVLLATLVASALTGMLVQTIKGYPNYEIGKYLAWYILPQALDWTLLAGLAVFLQVIAPHKFIGWGLMVLFLIVTLTAGNLGWDHNLLLFGGYPAVPLSDMNGTGDFGRTALWFRAYWTAFTLILLVAAYGLWRRGTENRFWPRLKRLPRRLMGPAGALAGVALVAFVGLGVFIYQNTNVWNVYRNSQDEERYLADFEKTLLKYEKEPQPSVSEVKLNLDLDPHTPRLETKGVYVLQNRTRKPLTHVHVRFARDLKVEALSLPGARPQTVYERFNYRILKLDRPMEPGETRELAFTTLIAPRGFKNRGDTTRLVDNGTFVDNSEFAAILGVDRGGMLQDRAKRRKYGLPPELRPRKLEDTTGQAQAYVPVDWVKADITVTTVADQTPIAPGYRISDETKDGRRTARFVTEAPILHFFSVQSARYAMKRKLHKAVELVVYYDPQHAWNVDRMLKAMEVGLDYYEPSFGAYQFRQARIIEFPAYARFAQAFANTMPYSESIGFVANYDDPEKIDLVTYVTAHELGHQWWAHQVIGADVQGATSLSETLAQYSALMVMEKLYGPEKIRKFLKYELDRYLSARGGEVVEELPLYRVENQGYIHYQKGGLVMYRLRDVMGEAAVNKALRRLIDKYAFKGAPYPRSTDLIAALRAEATPEQQALITDLFEKITLYDVKVKDAKAAKRGDGRYDVTLTVEAKKLYADGKGKETDAPLAEAFDVGLFTAEPGKKDFDAGSVIAYENRPIRSGVQTLRFVTAKAPKFVGVDPYNKRIDRNSEDNVLKVEG